MVKRVVDRVVFLDLNGCIGTFVPRAKRGDGELYLWWSDSITSLNRLTDACGASIVVTSTLRRGKSLGFIRSLLRRAGLRASVVDVTPNLEGATRGEEIRAWLELHEPVSYVIFDDRADIILPGFVRVGPGGIGEADLEAASAFLRSPPYTAGTASS